MIQGRIHPYEHNWDAMSAKVPIMDPLSLMWLDRQRAEHVPINTILRRESTLRSIGIAGTATRGGVEEWWSTRRHLAPATRTNDLANLRAFYKWAQRWEHRADDPTLRLDAPHVTNGLPRPMSRHDLHRLLADLPDDLRRAVALGAYGGLRVSEAAALRWPNVDQETRQLRVIDSKGGKSRAVPLGPILTDHLLPDTGGNVVTGKRAGYTAASLQRKVNRAIRGQGVDATFHQLRHRYGTIAYQATGDLVAVGRAMGHSSIVTTQIYAAANDDMSAKIAAAVER